MPPQRKAARARRIAIAVLASVLAGGGMHAEGAEGVPDLRVFIEAASADEKQARAALAELAPTWRDGYAPLLVDLARFMRPAPRTPMESGGEEGLLDDDSRGPGPAARERDRDLPAPAGRDPVSARIRRRLLAFLEKQTGQRFGDDLARWRRWYWGRPYEPHPEYAAFKAGLYAHVDPRMSAFFPPGAKELVRLDEVDWGGVKVDGIPPLDRPKYVSAREAGFLKDGHVVFGLEVDGDARAYPKRILAWHEMVRDRVGGVELAIVYCALCGTVIPYGAEVGGVKRTFGTSGLLYRSNKLMFDQESMSLWSTVEGRPVLGALAGQALQLTAYPVVTTTWKEWREAHPDTRVLSLDTGFERDYSEGAAYRDYFATDALMFAVPKTDGRLRNKDEVLALLVEGEPVAIAVRLLERNPVHVFEAAGRNLVVVTSREGANRVYDLGTGAPPALRMRPDGLLEVGREVPYRMLEEALVPEREADQGRGPLFLRVPARRAFWFGWVAQYPDTRLLR
jgi:hypothetical protein